MQNIVNIVYLVAAVLFIYDLKMLAHPRTAVRGNALGFLAMLLAIVATLVSGKWDWTYIILGIAIGSVIGTVAALKVKMTSMPELVGLFNGFGGGASVLVAGSALIATFSAVAAGTIEGTMQMKVATVLSGIIGSVTFFGSYVAFGKLAEFLCVKWKLYTWQKIIKYGFSFVVAGSAIAYGLSQGVSALTIMFMASGVIIGGLLLLKKDRFPGMNALKVLSFVASIAVGVFVIMNPQNAMLYWVLVGVGGVLGVVLTMSIGGADMPVVIALLNSYSGLAAAATGFVINNNVLIIAGSLVGASGLILTSIMCKAMNRSLANVLFAKLGPTADTPDADDVYRTVKSTSADEIAMLLENAQRVMIIPGYGMAVAQAQHAVRDFANQLEAMGAEVEYAIHPVAGRMPGHMNVLLAEADVPYEALKEMDEVNPTLETVDVAIVVGANDVVNPVARTDPQSPIAGMPIIDVDKCRTVIVIKRSLSPGFAGIPNPLFAMDNCLMFFNDGKKAILELVAAVKEL
ncbi:MAG: NAD(P)(+) transhydrogenase (Re/Si-specific) subunit beta [bacterium]|nr:NAD(P)(+) transhydrogenase (Re/Si-specific) subunit beta [bacterium]